ncbi:hypothetical protein [Streptomyces sp. NPDC006285]
MQNIMVQEKEKSEALSVAQAISAEDFDTVFSDDHTVLACNEAATQD